MSDRAGTLTQFMGMRKVYTKGLQQANKVMLMAGTAYNLKKYLRYTQKLERTVARAAEVALISFYRPYSTCSKSISALKTY